MTMAREASTLPSLIGEVLASLAASEAPSTELLARLVARIRETPAAEIQLGLHALWPFTRHITREEWLQTLSYELAKIPAAPPLRDDAQQWIRQWRIKQDAVVPTPGIFEEFAQRFRDRHREAEETEAAVGNFTRILTPGDNVAADQGTSAGAESQSARQDSVDPLARYLPPIDNYFDGSFWYEDESPLEDSLSSACVVLIVITVEVSARVNDDSLFWGVLGRVHEPFAPGNPDELEDKIESAKSEVLAVRIRDGQADLLDYMNYFEECRGLGDDFLESDYESFLAAVERASPAECEALFSQVRRLEYDPNQRPPRPAEEHLPVADRLWATILAKPELSVTLLARGGLFYWLCREPARAPTLALVALGRVCEGDCLEFWRVPPFLPFWAAARASVNEGDWDLAALCWKRALVDIILFVGALGTEGRDQVHAFPFDPRFVKDIYLRTAYAERPTKHMLHLALGHALDELRRSSLTDWSQVYLVLLELSRRLGVRAINEAGLADLLGKGLYAQIDHETRRFLAEAEHAWSYEAQTVDDGTDYVLIGLNYRRAIENEWRLRLTSALAMLDRKIRPDRAMLGEMLGALRKPGSIGQQLLRHHLAGVVRPDSRIFDQLFLRRASELVSDYLNVGPHRRLARDECLVLRSQLLKGRMLHDLLACVQPPDGG